MKNIVKFIFLRNFDIFSFLLSYFLTIFWDVISVITQKLQSLLDLTEFIKQIKLIKQLNSLNIFKNFTVML